MAVGCHSAAAAWTVALPLSQIATLFFRCKGWLLREVANGFEKYEWAINGVTAVRRQIHALQVMVTQGGAGGVLHETTRAE